MRSPGALVLSLDFELHWGVRQAQAAHGRYRAALLGTRSAIARTLDLFAERRISATWATVGILFLDGREAFEREYPGLRPVYRDAQLDPYREPVGADEAVDPLHFAPSVVESIRGVPGQEIGTHTFAHFFAGEAGATVEAFRADLAAAVSSAVRRGVTLRSIVFPRNQALPEYVAVLPDFGIDVYRGNPPGAMWAVERGEEGRHPARRLARLADTYLPLSRREVQRWDDVLEQSGLANVRASRFLRPYDPRLAAAESLRLARIVRGMERAAREGGLYHLWWHPHNFGRHTDENLSMLSRVLDAWGRLKDRYGFESMSMAQAADRARELRAAAT